MTIHSTIRLAAVGLVCLIGSGCEIDARSLTATGSFERTLKVTGPVDINVTTGSGRIQVRTGTGNRVRVVGSIRASGDWWTGERAEEQIRRLETDPPVEQSGNSIRI